MTEFGKAAVVLGAGAKYYLLIMAIMSSMITYAHSRKATAAGFIAKIHKQYRIGRHTNGSEKKHQKISDNDDSSHEASLAEVGISNSSIHTVR